METGEPTEVENGWQLIQNGITKLKSILEGTAESDFSSSERMMLYSTIYSMCIKKSRYDYSQQLYDKYKETFEQYLSETVLPSLSGRHDEFLLKELVKRWANHKIMARWLLGFFDYLNRPSVAWRFLPDLNEVSLTCFRTLVYEELKGKVTDAVIKLIDQEREGGKIDRGLVKNVLEIFVEIGMGQMDHYENDFEEPMLRDTTSYYSRKASNWIMENSCPDYMLQAEESLREEEDRVTHYLHSCSEDKLLEVSGVFIHIPAEQL